MVSDPWKRPTLEDLRQVLESIEKSPESHGRTVERLELSVPAEVTTARGNVVPAMTREISRKGIGLLHRGALQPGEAVIKMASDSREFVYQMVIEWCTPCENGMFMSGGRFVGKPQDEG